MLQQSWSALLAIFAVAALFCALILLTSRLHGGLSMDRQIGVQRVHSRPVPRIGGLALLAAILLSLGLNWSGSYSLGLALAAFIVFSIGLYEDLSQALPVKYRLFGTIAAGSLFSLLSGVAVRSVDLAFFDAVLAYWPAAVIFTGFAIGGLCHAMNMIDGVHGLSSGTTVICLIGAALLAGQQGDMDLVLISLSLAAAVAGFLVINFPLGRIFLGDGGAYLLGLALGVVAVMLPLRNPEISPWTSLLLLAYPLTEAWVSMFRRHVLHRRNVGSADSAHLHSLVYQRLSVAFQHRPWLRRHRNALTGLGLSCLAAIPVGFSLLKPENSVASFLLFIAFVNFYIFLYSLVVRRRSSASVTTRLRPVDL